MTPEEAAQRMQATIDALQRPQLRAAIEKTLGDYDQQVNMEFRDKVDPQGGAWPEWSESYKRQLIGRGMKQRRTGAVMVTTFEDYNKNPLTAPQMGESESHSLMVLTGTLYASALDMVHDAKVSNTGFELPPPETKLPEYAMKHEEGDGVQQRSFLGMGDMMLDEAVEYGVEAMNQQLLDVWS